MKKNPFILCIIPALLFAISCSKKSPTPTPNLSSLNSLKSQASSSVPKPTSPSPLSSTPTSSVPDVSGISTSSPVQRPNLDTLNKNRPNATIFGDSEFAPVLNEDFGNLDSKESAFTGEDEEDFESEYNQISDHVPEKEADIPIFNDSDIFFYQTISDDKPNEKFRIIDAQMTYNIDPSKMYTLSEILQLYEDDRVEKKPKKVDIPTFDSLKNQIAERNKNDQNLIRVDAVNTYKVDYERQRRREAILASNDYYDIAITNEIKNSGGQIRRSLGMMTLDTFISSVNRIELKTQEEAVLAGAVIYHATPIDFAISLSPYSLTYLMRVDDGSWVFPAYSFQATGRVHYKIQNDTNFMISAGLKFGINQSFKSFVYNTPLMLEVGLGANEFDIYAGAGVILSDPSYGFFSLGASVEGLYNIFFAEHSSVYFGANISLGAAVGNLVSGKKFEISKFFFAPVIGYKFAVDSVRNGKVISYQDTDWYEIVVVDEEKRVIKEVDEALTLHNRFFVEVHYSGSPFDCNIFVSPYSFAPFVELEPVFSISSLPKYAFNLGFSGHYKLLSEQYKSIGLGIRLDIAQAFNRTYTIVPFMVDANMSFLDIGVDVHAGLGLSITHRAYGGTLLGLRVGGSYNLPLTKRSFLTLGLDLGARLKLDFSTDKIITLTHIQVDPSVGYKYSFDLYERIVFDAVSGFATDECYIIDIVNDADALNEEILKENK